MRGIKKGNDVLRPLKAAGLAVRAVEPQEGVEEIR
jgi:hypothetical protein